MSDTQGTAAQGVPPGAPAAANQLASASGTGAAASSSSSLFGPGGGGLVIAPGAAGSAYEYQAQLEGTSVILGSTLAQMLGGGLPANTAVPSSKVVAAFLSAPRNSQILIENLLAQAGFYQDPTTGQTLSQPPDAGTTDASNQNAFSLALLNAYNQNLNASTTGTSVSSLVASNIYSGAGALARQTSPSPVLGGGQAYQNLVTAPADLYDSLYTTFENTLGRAPSQKELNNFVQTFQTMQSNYQQALNVQQEDVSGAKYQQQVTARNTEMQYQVTPRIAAGPVPNPGAKGYHTPAAAVTAFLQYASNANGGGDNLATASNVSFLLAVMTKMGGWGQAQATHNLFGATLPGAGEGTTVGIHGPKPSGPQHYTNWQQGFQQTLDQLSTTGSLWALIEGGNAAHPSPALMSQVTADLGSWSNGKIKTFPTPTKANELGAHAAAAAAAKGTAAVNAKLTAQPPGTYNPASGPPQAGFAGPGGKSPATPATGTGPTSPQTGAYPGQFTGGGPPPAGLAGGGGTVPNTTFPSGGAASPGVSGGANLPNETNNPLLNRPGQQGLGGPATPGAPAQNPRFSTPSPDANAKGGKGGKKGGAPLPPTNLKPATPAAPLSTAYQGQTTPAYDVVGQNQFSTGDTYIEPSTLYGTMPPTQSGLAFEQATTGANAVPYETYNYIQAFDSIANMIASGQAA